MEIEWEESSDGLVDIHTLRGGDVFSHEGGDPRILEWSDRVGWGLVYPLYSLYLGSGSRIAIEKNVRVKKLNAKLVIMEDK